MEGQYTDKEMKDMSIISTVKEYQNGYCIAKYGKHTFNYYRQESDGSWTNYDCKTKY